MSTVQRIGFSQAKKLLDSRPEAILLDVREEEEYINGHAVGARLLSVYAFTDDAVAEVLPSYDVPVLVYCRTGRRSAIAAEKLYDLGYNEIYDLGSLAGWPYGME